MIRRRCCFLVLWLGEPLLAAVLALLATLAYGTVAVLWAP